MLKRILSVVLCLVLVFSIAFQCSFHSSAVVVADDAILIGCAVAISLISMGITLQNTTEFFDSDTWYYMAKDIAGNIDEMADDVYIWVNSAGKWVYNIASNTWNNISNWVKSKFQPGVSNQTIDIRTHRPSHPSTITLKNGTSVPYGQFMQYPFFIYELPANGSAGGGIYAWYCDGQNPGVNYLTRTLRMWCSGTGTVHRFALENGAWSDAVDHTMNYGLSYKGTVGSFYDINFTAAHLVGQTLSDIMQYRTMDLVYDSGAAQEQAPPNQVPSVDTPDTVSVTASSDAAYYPGAVDAPVSVLPQSESIVFDVPEGLIEGLNTANPSLTTNPAVAAEVVGDITTADVKPKVRTDNYSVSGTVDQVIASTPSVEMEVSGNAASDIEIANKFRLPRSFLEGFPFSIPYSIYIGIQSFVADPQAPVFDIPFSISRLGIDETVSVDLSQWNPVARLCRALLSMVWVAGLAMACSKFIKR